MGSAAAVRRALVVLAAAVLVAACSGASGTPTANPAAPSVAPSSAPSAPPPSTPAGPSPSAPARPPATAVPAGSGAPVVLVGAGDIGDCNHPADVAATAHLVETVAPPDAIVFTAGDNAYPNGSTRDFARCYDPTWGAFRDRTRPAAGNHDWHTAGAVGYRAYFGAAAGPADATWYAYDAGTWRVIVLDSDCAEVGGCDPTSPQGRWLAAELADHPAACSLAIWHHPRFSSGSHHGSDRVAAPLLAAVAAAGVDLVVNGHEHGYERFDRLAPDGGPDPAGVREIVVGTGGGTAYDFAKPLPGSRVRLAGMPAVLVLELGLDGYAWRLVGAPGAETLDDGTDTCR